MIPPAAANRAASTKIVIADHAQGVAERRLRNLAHGQQPAHQQHATREIEMHMIRQIDAEKHRTRNAAAQALVAAGKGGPRQDG